MRFHGGDSGEKLSKKEATKCALIAIGILGLPLLWLVFAAPWLDSIVVINSIWLDELFRFALWFVGIVPVAWFLLSQPMWIKSE